MQIIVIEKIYICSTCVWKFYDKADIYGNEILIFQSKRLTEKLKDTAIMKAFHCDFVKMKLNINFVKRTFQ